MKSLALVTALAIVLVPALASAQEPTRPYPQIRVMGEGSATRAPDMAVTTLSIVTEAETAREALTANNESMAKVLNAMKEAGIEDRDLQTENFRIDPRYRQPDPKSRKPETPQIDGYRVFNSLTVRIRDLSSLGTILDTSVSLGVNEGGNIRFTNASPDEAIEEARKMAMKDAMARAKTLAEAAGANMGAILEISERDFRPAPLPMANSRAMAMDEMAAVPVASGENEYRVTVHLAVELLQ